MAWTSKPSMIRQIMQRRKTRICSGPIWLFSSNSPMLILLTAWPGMLIKNS